MFSLSTIPMSTIVPIAIAMPDSATTFASTRKSFMKMKVNSTAIGKSAEISTEERRCINMKSTTMIVTRISSPIAFLSVPSVSSISPARS